MNYIRKVFGIYEVNNVDLVDTHQLIEDMHTLRHMYDYHKQSCEKIKKNNENKNVDLTKHYDCVEMAKYFKTMTKIYEIIQKE